MIDLFLSSVIVCAHYDIIYNPCIYILYYDCVHTHAGIAIGGDSFPGSTLCDHCLRYEHIDEVSRAYIV